MSAAIESLSLGATDPALDNCLCLSPAIRPCYKAYLDSSHLRQARGLANFCLSIPGRSGTHTEHTAAPTGQKLISNLVCRHLPMAVQGPFDSSQHTPQVKICGITSEQDAKLAASAGADMLGMIMWQKAKRAVSASVARDIASVAEDHGIQSVGVFVDESAQQIQDMCGESGIQVAQLHGKGARQALCQLPENLHVVYVMNSDGHGIIQTPSPAQLAEQSEQVLSRYSCVHV